MKHPPYPDVLPALTAACRRQIDRRLRCADIIRPSAFTYAWNRDFYREVFAKGDIAAGRYGPLTTDVAREYGYPIDVTRRQLVKALAAGTVLADGRGGVGGIRWWPVGLVAQLLQEPAQ
jgi:hypothetical protein